MQTWLSLARNFGNTCFGRIASFDFLTPNFFVVEKNSDFFGFSVFLSSNFGGTQALGGLVAVTLMMAMLANLILLPSLLISLEDSISNEKVLKEPKLEILD